jgi:hypothetical protein
LTENEKSETALVVELDLPVQEDQHWPLLELEEEEEEDVASVVLN